MGNFYGEITDHLLVEGINLKNVIILDWYMDNGSSFPEFVPWGNPLNPIKVQPLLVTTQ